MTIGPWQHPRDVRRVLARDPVWMRLVAWLGRKVGL